MFKVELSFHGDLRGFLARESRENGLIARMLKEKTAVKDVIEACGVPHTEVDLIAARASDGVLGAAGFSRVVEAPVNLEIYPAPAPAGVLPAAPRLQRRVAERFVADGHLGKLARNLRLLGLDTAYERDVEDRRLLEIMVNENRVLLTRDRRLLMHSVVRDGYCPRSSDSMEQTREILRRFSLLNHAGHLAPYRRCLRCNGHLEPAEKSQVLEPLAAEPLTLRFYDDFRRCSNCGSIYWPGTHYQKLSARVADLLGNC